MIIGQHFLDRNKNWSLTRGKEVALVDLAYVTNASSGFSVQETLERLAGDCNALWEAGAFPKPYLRIDYSPNITLAREYAYTRAVEQAMRWWTSAPRANLTIIIGNEPNLVPLTVEICTTAVKDAVSLRNLLGYPVRIFAPAIAPWCGNNVDTPGDFYPSPRGASTEWENWQYGLVRGCDPDGFAVHAYGRPWHIFDKDEPHRFTPFDNRGASNGFLWLRDAAAIIGQKPIAITETNTFTDRPSSQSYPYQWLNEAKIEADKLSNIESLCWFVGESHGVWLDESLKQRIGQCAAADDDFNSLL